LDGVAWKGGKEKIAFLPAQTVRLTKLASDIAFCKKTFVSRFLYHFSSFPPFSLFILKFATETTLPVC
jgi:hypothetical protein